MSAPSYLWPGAEITVYTSGNETPLCGKCGAENCTLIVERPAALTTREKEIIQGVVQACNNKDIAVKFNISEQTVKNHLHNIFEKLAIYSRLELALYAIHQGLHQ